jgi:hypothetical protein
VLIQTPIDFAMATGQETSKTKTKTKRKHFQESELFYALLRCVAGLTLILFQFLTLIDRISYPSVFELVICVPRLTLLNPFAVLPYHNGFL